MGVPKVKALREVERSHGLDFLFGIHCFQISRHILHIYICLICQWFSYKCFKANKSFYESVQILHFNISDYLPWLQARPLQLPKNSDKGKIWPRDYQNQRSESWGHRVQYTVLSLKLQGEGSEGQTCRQRLLPDQGAPSHVRQPGATTAKKAASVWRNRNGICKLHLCTKMNHIHWRHTNMGTCWSVRKSPSSVLTSILQQRELSK